MADENLENEGTLFYPILGWPVWMSYLKCFHYTLVLEQILSFFMFAIFFSFESICVTQRYASLGTSYWNYCYSDQAVTPIYGHTAVYVGMIVVFAVSYVLRTQAKKNSDIDTIRWRLDFWFVLRTFVWLLCFANFFIRGVYLANYHNDTGSSIALFVGSLLVVYVMLLGLQGHRGGKRCLDLGDIHMKGKQLHVYFTDDRDEEKGSPGKKDGEGGKKGGKSDIEKPLNEK
jgi:hypothetical protein